MNMSEDQAKLLINLFSQLKENMEGSSASSQKAKDDFINMTEAMAKAAGNSREMKKFFESMSGSAANMSKKISESLLDVHDDIKKFDEKLAESSKNFILNVERKMPYLFPLKAIESKIRLASMKSKLMFDVASKSARAAAVMFASELKDSVKRDFKIINGLFKASLKILSVGLSSGISLALSLLDIFKNIITTTYKLGEAFLMLPYKVFDKISEAAHSIREEFMQIKQTYEDTQQTIDGRSIEGRGILSLTHSARGLATTFQNVGSIYTRVFGFGLQGQQALIAKTAERISNLGTLSAVFASEIRNSALEFEVYQQRLGMSSQDLEIAARSAIAQQESLGEILERRRVQLDDISKRYSLNSLMVAKGFNELRTNVVEFGHISDKALLDVTARAAQLGIEAKDLNAIFSKFTTFDAAAESAALLSQTFGMAVDAMQIIKAEDPMQIVDQFRESMMQTGRSFEDLNRHEKSLLEQYTGLRGEVLQTAMSFRGVGMSYEDLQKKMEETSPQGKMIAAVKEMTAAIKEFAAVGEKLTNPFQAMIKGIEMGITKNTKFRNELVSFSNVLQDIYVNVMESVAGNTEFIDQLTDFINKFKKAMSGPVIGGFITLTSKIMNLFDAIFLSGNYASTAIQHAVKEIVDVVFDREKGIGKLVHGMLDIGKAIVGNLIRGIINSIPAVIETFTELIKGITEVISGGNSVLNSTEGFINDYILMPLRNIWPKTKILFNDMFTGLGDLFAAFKNTRAYQSILNAATELGEKITDGIINGLTKAFSSATPYILSYLTLKIGAKIVALFAAQGLAAGSAFSSRFTSIAGRTIPSFLGSKLGRFGLAGLGAGMGYSAVNNFREGDVAQGVGSSLMSAGAIAMMFPGIGTVLGGSLLALGGLTKAVDYFMSDGEESEQERQQQETTVRVTQESSDPRNDEAVRRLRDQLLVKDDAISRLRDERNMAIDDRNRAQRQLSERLPPIELPINMMLNGQTLTDSIFSTAFESTGRYQIGVENNRLIFSLRDSQQPDVTPRSID